MCCWSPEQEEKRRVRRWRRYPVFCAREKRWWWSAQSIHSVLAPEEAQQAARLCRENHVDLILGVGGGAVLDCCKATALAAVCRGDLWEDFWLRRGVVDRQPLPVDCGRGHRDRGGQRRGGAAP